MARSIARDKKGYLIIIERKIFQEDTIRNVCVPDKFII